MTWEPQKMETADGTRYRFWTTVSDSYVDLPMPLDEAASLWALRRGLTHDEAAAQLARIAEPVKRWYEVVYCGDCGGWLSGGDRYCCGQEWEPSP